MNPEPSDVVERLLELADGRVPVQFKYGQGIHAYKAATMREAASVIAGLNRQHTEDLAFMDQGTKTLNEQYATILALREALKPFAEELEQHDATYRKRGGQPDMISDRAPFMPSVGKLPLVVWRRALSAYRGKT